MGRGRVLEYWTVREETVARITGIYEEFVHKENYKWSCGRSRPVEFPDRKGELASRNDLPVLRLSKNRVIANQPEGWCGDLRVFAGNPGFLTKNVAFLWGIATPV